MNRLLILPTLSMKFFTRMLTLGILMAPVALFFIAPAAADPEKDTALSPEAAVPAVEKIIRVQTPELTENFELNLKEGRKGIIEVFLMSTGDPLDGYKIELFDISRKKSLKIVPSTEDGLLRFRGIAPGVYRVYLRKDPELHKASSVKVADIKLKQE